MHTMNNKHIVKIAALAVAMAALLMCRDSIAADFDLAGAKIDVRGQSRSVRMAAEELRKHLNLISGETGGASRSARGRFVLGVSPEGTSDAKPFTSQAREKDGIIYFWGDDSEPKDGARWGTLFAVYGFLEKHLGVKWVELLPRPPISPCSRTSLRRSLAAGERKARSRRRRRE